MLAYGLFLHVCRLYPNLETQRVDFVFGTPDAHRKTGTRS